MDNIWIRAEVYLAIFRQIEPDVSAAPFFFYDSYSVPRQTHAQWYLSKQYLTMLDRYYMCRRATKPFYFQDFEIPDTGVV